MLTKTFEIKNKLGLHARPAALFVQQCNNFTSEINLKKDEKTVNGKSIIGVMALAVGRGESVEVSVEGSDEQAAMDAIQQFFEEKAETV